MNKPIVIDEAQALGAACQTISPVANGFHKVQRLFGKLAVRSLAAFAGFEEMANACLLG